jgi:hypothetical protein
MSTCGISQIRVGTSRRGELGDLAARINAEHEACASTLKRGLQHAIAAGRLLIEAKDKLKHGGWMRWLRENCQVPERTAQAYMRVARTFGTLEQANTQRVADLSSAIRCACCPSRDRRLRNPETSNASSSAAQPTRARLGTAPARKLSTKSGLGARPSNVKRRREKTAKSTQRRR